MKSLLAVLDVKPYNIEALWCVLESRPVQTSSLKKEVGRINPIPVRVTLAHHICYFWRSE